MAIHAPTIQHRQTTSVAGLGPLLIAIVLLAMLAALLVWAFPQTTTPTTSSQVWMTEQRHGEIDAGLSGAPHGNYLIYRAGEINAGSGG